MAKKTKIEGRHLLLLRKRESHKRGYKHDQV
jgi:hypothetical protein